MNGEDPITSGTHAGTGGTGTAAARPGGARTRADVPARRDVLWAYRSTSAPGLDTSTVGFDDVAGADDPAGGARTDGVPGVG